MTEDQAPRTNRDGHPCPPWCTSSHERWDGHSGDTARIDVPGKVRDLPDAFLVGRYQFVAEAEKPQVSVSPLRYGRDGTDPAFWMPARDAEGLAVIVELLAAATPGQHRELAAAIRKAAADITDATEENR